MSEDAPDEVDFEPETGTYRTTFDGEDVTPSTAVVETVAAVRGVDPMELDPLYEVVDPQALDRLVAPRPPRRTGDCTVVFTYFDHEVTVRSPGIVRVRPLEDVGGDADT